MDNSRELNVVKVEWLDYWQTQEDPHKEFRAFWASQNSTGAISTSL